MDYIANVSGIVWIGLLLFCLTFSAFSFARATGGALAYHLMWLVMAIQAIFMIGLVWITDIMPIAFDVCRFDMVLISASACLIMFQAMFIAFDKGGSWTMERICAPRLFVIPWGAFSLISVMTLMWSLQACPV